MLTKGNDGRYILTEKGKLATRLLTEFPEQNRKQMGVKPKWWRKFWIGIGAATVLITVTNLIVYFLGYVDLTKLFQSFFVTLALIGVLYMIQHITMEVLSEKNRARLLKTNNFARGMVIGFLLWLALTFGMIYSGFSRITTDALGQQLEIVTVLSSLMFCLFTGNVIGKWLAKKYYQTF